MYSKLMNKKWRKYLAMLLAVVMTVTQAPSIAWADDGTKDRIVIDLLDVAKTLSKSRGEGINPDKITHVSDNVKETLEEYTIVGKGSIKDLKYVIVTSSMNSLDDEVYEENDYAAILGNIVYMGVVVINRSKKDVPFDVVVDTQGFCDEAYVEEIQEIDEAAVIASGSNAAVATGSEADVATGTNAISAFGLVEQGNHAYILGAGGSQFMGIKLYGFKEVKKLYAAYKNDKNGVGEYRVTDANYPSPKDHLVYCHNHKAAGPPEVDNVNASGLFGKSETGDFHPHYERYNYEEYLEDEGVDGEDVTASFDKDEAINLLYAGYPFDSLGLQKKTKITDMIALGLTQAIFWEICDEGGDAGSATMIDYIVKTKEDYRHDYVMGLMDAIKSNASRHPQLHILNLSGESGVVEFIEQKDGTYLTNLLTITSSFGIDVTFVDLPNGISVLDEKGKEIEDKKLKMGSKIRLKSDTKVDSTSVDIRFRYKEADIYYYKNVGNLVDRGGNGLKSNYQNLVGAYLLDEVITVQQAVTFKDGEPVKPIDPVDPVNPSEPETAPTSTEEPTEPTSSEPVTEPTSSEPVTEPTSSEPVTEPTSSEPVTEPTSSAPVTEPTSSEPVTEPTSSAPVTEPTTTERETSTTVPETSTTVADRETTAPDTSSEPETTVPDTAAPETTETPETTITPETTVTPETTSRVIIPSFDGGGGGGGGGGGRPSYTTDNGTGPGTTPNIAQDLEEIPDEPVPLAAAPVQPDPTMGNLVEIDDGNVPLAGLPKTGERTKAKGMAFAFASMLGGLYLLLEKRRKQSEK